MNSKKNGEKKISRVGAEDPVRDLIKIDVRFIAAAQPKDLDLILDDLKSRLGHPDFIEMPTLRETLNEGDEIASYIFKNVLNSVLKTMRHFRLNSENVLIRKDSERVLLSHKYSGGNYRELWNILRSAVIRMRSRSDKEDEIIPEDLFAITRSPRPDDTEPTPVHEIPIETIKLSEIIPYANAKKAAVVEEQLCRILKDGKDIKSVFIAEGNPPKEYQKFLKTVRNIMGKSIHELKRSLKR